MDGYRGKRAKAKGTRVTGRGFDSVGELTTARTTEGWRRRGGAVRPGPGVEIYREEKEWKGVTGTSARVCGVR